MYSHRVLWSWALLLDLACETNVYDGIEVEQMYITIIVSLSATHF